MSPRLVVVLGFGLVVGLVAGLGFGLGFGWVNGLVGGLFFGLVTGLFSLLGVEEMKPVDTVSWSWSSWRKEGRFALNCLMVLGLVFGLADVMTAVAWVLGTMRSAELVEGLVGGLFAWLVIALFLGLLVGLVPGTIPVRTTPNEGTRRSGRNGLFCLLAVGLGIGLGIGLPAGLLVRLDRGLGTGLGFGLFFGLFFGLIRGGLFFLRHWALRLLLWLHGDAPLRYVRFLDTATDRLFLRKVGGGYIFVHRMLLDYFALLGEEAAPNQAAASSHSVSP